VRLFTIQHHFGSKQRLYEEILGRWDSEVQELMSRVLADGGDPRQIVERVVDALFDFFLANRGRVALNARAALGEGLPRRLVLGDQSWVRFMGSSMTKHRLGRGGLDLGLLLITVEGVLHNHVLAAPHYRHLFGRDVTDPRVAARVKRHLQQVILALLGGADSST
jgi:AcrR family transcriptional regulator